MRTENKENWIALLMAILAPEMDADASIRYMGL